MAASIMMETLKQIQRDLTDQKEYIRNLHVINKNINEKYDNMEGNLSSLHKKIDQQQLTIERLEQHVKKNNMLLFGNDDPESNFEDKSIVLKQLNYNEKDKKHDNNLASVENIKCMFAEINELLHTVKETGIEEAEANCKDDNKNEQFQEINNDEVKGEEFTSNEIREMKELIKEYVAARKTSTEETMPVRKEKVLEISPTFFSEDQISKLNEELDRITETYRCTDTFPIIKVVPGPHKEHSVITQLRKGVLYKQNDGNATYVVLIKFGTGDYKISEVREMLTEYPDLTLFDVVKRMLIFRKKWNDVKEKIDFRCPKPYEIVL